MKKDSTRLEPLIDDAIQTLQTIFRAAGEHSGDELAVARLANSVLATWSKLKQSESAQEAVYFSMARELAEDREQLAHYIEVTMPHVPLAQGSLKKLPKPKDK